MHKKIDIAKEYGQSYARAMFKDFLDHPEWRGKKFEWTGFSDSISRLAAGQVGLNLWWKGRSDKLLQKCQDVASAAARETWIELVKEHNLLA